MKNFKILGIESSCDDSCAAVICAKKVLSTVCESQISHKKFGGVIPEVASREHLKNIDNVVKKALEEARVTLYEVDAIAYTQGPGLLGPLLVGGGFARGLGFANNIPLVAVNHMRGHVLSNFLNLEEEVIFPMLCLTVSGGHTQLVWVEDFLKMSIVGETLDDAIGEAFDKIGKLLKLPYPAGPHIDMLGAIGEGDKFIFPNTEVGDLNFSFSGIKTAFANFLKKNTEKEEDFIEKNINDICASIQKKLIDMVIKKLKKSVEIYNPRSIGLAGGVAANSSLRAIFYDFGEKKKKKIYTPEKKFCTDNAAMIALGGYYKFLNGELADISTISYANLKF